MQCCKCWEASQNTQKQPLFIAYVVSHIKVFKSFILQFDSFIAIHVIY